MAGPGLRARTSGTSPMKALHVQTPCSAQSRAPSVGGDVQPAGPWLGARAPHLPRILGEDGRGLLGVSEQDVLLVQKAPL